MTEVVAAMAEAGLGDAEHVFGARGQFEHAAPPRYVWVPSRLESQESDPQTPHESQFRSLYVAIERVSVFCWGATFAQASALRQNLVKALHDVAAAFVEPAGGEWVHPGEYWTGHGEMFELEFRLLVPFPDAFVSLTALEEPRSPAVIPTRNEVGLFVSKDADTPGELAAKFDTTP